ncbi:uncharacterized protein [Watersipora subatra]|uniref:uncharacterized protein n=1 Tax=Watersipora subatra TaxID=2589382 RepID=UPI00355AEED0
MAVSVATVVNEVQLKVTVVVVMEKTVLTANNAGTKYWVLESILGSGTGLYKPVALPMEKNLTKSSNEHHNTFDQIKALRENKVETVTQNFFEQYIAESQQLRDYLQQREERHEQDEQLLQKEEAALQEAKAQLEEQMKQLQARMAARQVQLLRETSSDKAESAQQLNQAAIQTAPPLPTGHRRSVLEADTMPQNSHVSSQPIRRQEHQPVRASAIELNRESTSEQPILPQASRHSFQAQHESLGRYQAAQQWSPTTATSQQNLLNKAEDIADAVTKRMHISLLASAEPFVFSGDPLQYADWRASFNGLIHSKEGTPIEKLQRLRKYVSGEALEAISGYFGMQTTNAYEEALVTLQEEFGRDDFVENGDRDKQRLAAQAAIPNLKALDEKKENKKFIKALPGWAINRWMYVVTDQEEKKGFPPLSKYVEFVAREARVSNNNLRDGSGSKPNSKPKANISDKPQNARSYRSNASKAEDCIFCHKNSHRVTECRSLAAKSEEDKKKFIMERRLCFGCIKPGHSSKSCSERATCGKCGKAHPTALHQERSSTKEKATKQESTKEKQIQPPRSGESVTESKKVNANAAKQGQSRLLSIIVPVYVGTSLSEQLVYAFLDTQSDVSFISQSLASKIKPTFTTERITITTLNGQKTKLLNCYKLTVRGFGLAAKEELEIEAYEQECIPCAPTQIPNKSHVADLPHLKSLLRKLPPKMDIPVGLLVGVDCSKALASLETILGQEGQPFAVKTKLGWTLCGEISKPVQEFTVHNTQIKEECVLVDHSLGQPKLSQHDLQLLDTLEGGIRKLESGSYCLPLQLKDKCFMPNNKAQVEKRLKRLVERFKRDEEYKKEYFSFVKDIVDNGFVEVAADEADKGNEWYIPHFGIYHP